MGASLAVIEARQAPWWPGDLGGGVSKASGDWSDKSPVPGGAGVVTRHKIIYAAKRPCIALLSAGTDS